jgi:WG containing repeat
MRKLFVLISLVWTTTVLFAQTKVIQVKSIDTRLWGYADINGQIIIPAKYARCNEFSPEGLAAISVVDNKEYYFIDLKGSRVPTDIQLFRLIDTNIFMRGYSDGMVAVKYKDKWGFLDSEGHVAIALKYDMVQPFKEGFTVARRGAYFMVLNKKGEEFLFEASDIRPFSGGYAGFASDGKFGFVDQNGKVVIPAQYNSIGGFNGGISWARDSHNTLGYINTKGEWVLKPQYDQGADYDPGTGLALAVKNRLWRYVNMKGEKIYLKGVLHYYSFSEGLAMAKANTGFGFVNEKGDWWIKPTFNSARPFKNGYAAAKVKGLWGLIDTNGKWVIQPKFIGIKDVEIVN